jgi:hypothetical protein
MFTKRDRLAPPGKCPFCRSEPIFEPLSAIRERNSSVYIDFRSTVKGKAIKIGFINGDGRHGKYRKGNCHNQNYLRQRFHG